MGRPKEFEPTVVLERATEVFWRQGYEATSVEDLVQAMGIQRGSLYATFGSKHDLFVAALKHYREQSITRIERLLTEEPSPITAIERALNQVVDQAFEQKRRWGCLVTNSAVELANRDRGTLEQVEAHRQRVEACFARSIQSGQAVGEIRNCEPAAALANYVVGVIQGLRVMTKTAETRAQLDDIVRITLDSLRA